ncbi:tyrosine-type recombinase/integrase [Arthrobacter castelli]|uniref:tyrosine-type recombinase/integrase n=1 Tax=Arthrobacter castelli TaxID=271431 RepID=UPI0004291B87|nr:tyrosine-type recombinase/integrase [Arthrobacter castelli]
MNSTPSLAALHAPDAAPVPEIDAELHELEEVSRNLQTHTLSANTRAAYAKAWRSFEGFCHGHGLDPVPAHPETVRWYVAWMSVQHDVHGLPRFSVATIRQHLAGVADHHLQQGLLDPTGHHGVSSLVRGLAKLRATRPARKRPLLLDDLLRIIAAMEHDAYPAGVTAARDTAALWLGFAGALRRSEAAALTLESLQLHPVDGIHIHVGRSKAGQDNTGADVVVLPFGATPRTCAPCAIHRWVALLLESITDNVRLYRQAVMSRLFAYQLDTHVCGVDSAGGGAGLISSSDLASPAPLLRATYRNRKNARIHAAGITGDALGAMLDTRMTEAGMDPGEYGFHSLRSGHVTQARRNGASTDEIMRAGRWQRAETVTVYDREFNPAARNSVTRLGL